MTDGPSAAPAPARYGPALAVLVVGTGAEPFLAAARRYLPDRTPRPVRVFLRASA